MAQTAEDLTKFDRKKRGNGVAACLIGPHRPPRVAPAPAPRRKKSADSPRPSFRRTPSRPGRTQRGVPPRYSDSCIRNKYDGYVGAARLKTSPAVSRTRTTLRRPKSVRRARPPRSEEHTSELQSL